MLYLFRHVMLRMIRCYRLAVQAVTDDCRLTPSRRSGQAVSAALKRGGVGVGVTQS